MKKIFSKEDMKLLERVIMIVYESGKCPLDRPKKFFLETMMCFYKAGGAINMRKSIYNCTKEEMAFMKIIDELRLELKRGVLAEYPRIVTGDSIVTQAMLKGARRAEIKHRRELGKDY